MARGRGRNLRRRSAGAFYDPNLYQITPAGVSSAQTNTQMYSNSIAQRVLLRIRYVSVFFAPPAAATTIYLIVRRIPSGYGAPAITLGSGTSTFQDQPDVMAYGILRTIVGQVDPVRIPVKFLSRVLQFNETDTLSLQLITDNAVASNFYGEVEFGTATIA